MDKIEIKNRFNSTVIYSHECDDNTIKITAINAILNGISLSDADLSDADLRYADLSDADLSGADLSGADLRYANLRDANLRGADLSGANLHVANLHGANLHCADLSGAAVVIYGPMWSVYITNNHIRIGCQSHNLNDWVNYTDEEIENMDNDALEFWKENKEFIINQCRKLTK